MTNESELWPKPTPQKSEKILSHQGEVDTDYHLGYILIRRYGTGSQAILKNKVQ